jgi:hypothetical protein
MRLRSIVIALALLFSVVIARADDASKAAKIEGFFKLAKLDQLSAQTMKQAMDQVNSGMMQQITGVKLTPDQQQKSDELSQKVMKIISDAMSWDKLEPAYAKLYMDAYTEAQIDDIVAFYKSPTGQVMVEKTPTLVTQANAVVKERMSSAIPEIQKIMKDYLTQVTSAATN